MKVIIFLLMSVTSLGAFAMSAPLNCFYRANATNGGNLNRDASVALCAGASDDSPVRCYLDAHSTLGLNLNQDAAIEFCTGKKSVDRLDRECTFKAISIRPGNPMSADDAGRLCAGATTDSPAKCFAGVTGYSWTNISQDEAIELCRLGDEKTVDCFIEVYSGSGPGLGRPDSIRLCKTKAP
jgi:hypothetical protein